MTTKSFLNQLAMQFHYARPIDTGSEAHEQWNRDITSVINAMSGFRSIDAARFREACWEGKTYA